MSFERLFRKAARLLPLFLAMAAAMVTHPARAQNPTIQVRLVPDVPADGWQYAREVMFPLSIRYPGSCDEHIRWSIPGSIVTRVGGMVVNVRDSIPVFSATCANGERTLRSYGAFLTELPFGTYPMSLEYVGSGDFASTSVTVPIVIRPDATSPYFGSGRLAAGTAVRYFGGMRCTAESMEFSPAPFAPASLPPDTQFTYGVLDYRFENCAPDCDFTGCNFVGIQSVKATLLEFPSDLPPDASLWVLDTSVSATTAWTPQQATINGRFAKVYLAGTRLSYDPATYRYSSLIRGSIGLAMPTRYVSEKELRGMWWGGPGEDGWGVAIAQSGDRLFATLHVYDDEGQPAFYLLRDGAWDAARTVYRGTLHRPNARSMGEPVGSASIAFTDTAHATLRYVLPEGEGAKTIGRMAFGDASAQERRHAGIWDLTLAGTGALTISEEGNALFITWLEFPGGGQGQWMVAPAGEWTAPDTFEAPLYRTTGSRWAGAEYDRTRLNAQPVGSLKVRFVDSDEGEVTYTIGSVTRTSPLRRHAF